MELLAPAGSIESMKAAIAGGADAVYIGGRDFGARRLAPNFDDEELVGGIDLAHDNGVKVYITVNTLVKENELENALGFADLLKRAGADALIVQDRGLMDIVRREIRMPMHASTQMGIHSTEGVRWAKENGLERVILARELDIDSIQRIANETDVGLEVFIHGALCYCFSGQCLFSSFFGGRSGNRGMCAQPCRKKYRMREKEEYFLSTGDTYGIDSIPDLMKVGIRSLKIEGRMRSPLYVYLASRIYSQAIKRAENGEETLITDRDKELLEIVFNRGFHRGYLRDESVMQTAYPDSRGRYLGESMMEPTGLRLGYPTLLMGDGITLYKDNVKVGGFEIDADRPSSMVPPFQVRPGAYSVYKTKDREFSAIESLFQRIVLRRRAMPRRKFDLDLKESVRDSGRGELSFYVSSLKVLHKVIEYADRIYFEGMKQYQEAKEICHAQGIEFVCLLPRLGPSDVDDGPCMVNSIDQYQMHKERKLYASHHMNIFNSRCTPSMWQWTLSPELNADEIAQICRHTSQRLEVMVFGRLELMISKDPCIPEGTMIDEKGRRFSITRDNNGYVHIGHSSDLSLLERLVDLKDMGIDSFGLDLRRRHPDLAGFVAETFAKADIGAMDELRRKCDSVSQIHFNKGVF